MLYRVLADGVVLVHLLFILFVIGGGFLVLRSKHVAWIHLPAVLWGALIEFKGWVCPLTPLENMLREKSGALGYQAGFIEHYLMPLIYPSVLDRRLQIVLGLLVSVGNLLIYSFILYRHRSVK